MTFSNFVQLYHQLLYPELSRTACVRQLLTKVLKEPDTLPPNCNPTDMDPSRLNKYYRGTNGLKGPAPYWVKDHLDGTLLKQDLQHLDNATRQELCHLFKEALPNIRPSQVPTQLPALLLTIIRSYTE